MSIAYRAVKVLFRGGSYPYEISGSLSADGCFMGSEHTWNYSSGARSIDFLLLDSSVAKFERSYSKRISCFRFSVAKNV